MLKTNQTVTTPHGKGVFQHRLFSGGEVLAMVALKKDVQVDPDQCKAYYFAGGIWQLVGYPIDEVTEEAYHEN